MAGKENLIPLNKRSKAEQREIQLKGTKASKEKRARVKTYREMAKTLLPTVVADEDMTAQARKLGIEGDVNIKLLTVLGIIKAACGGDVKAFEKLEDLTGENQSDTGQLEKLLKGLKDG